MTDIARPHLSSTLVSFAATAPQTWQTLLDKAVAADRAGVDRLVCPDHVVMGEHLDAYGNASTGGTAGGRQPTGPDGIWLEPLTLLSMVAGLTERVRLGNGILLAALRRPVVLAKALATLDVLSGGRVDLGVGVGWQREEYAAAGLSFDARGRLLDDTLELLQRFWADGSASHTGDGISFESIHCNPKPLQSPMPIWVSGRSTGPAMRRLARFGTGWIPWGDDAADLVESIPRMREAVAAAGADPTHLDVTASLRLGAASTHGELLAAFEKVPQLVEAGVTDIRAATAIPDDPTGAYDHLARVVVAFREVVDRDD